MRSLTALLLVVSITLVACNPDETDSPTATPTGVGQTATPASPDDTDATPAGDGFPGSTRCESPEGYSVAYPSSWFTNSGDVVAECGQFSPEEFEVPDGTDERVAPITVYIDPVEFVRAATPNEEFNTELTRATTVIDDRQAVRVEQESTSGGFYPEGIRQTLYIVDLSLGTDDTEPGTLFLDTVEIGDFDYEANVEILDRMARSLQISAGEEPEEDVPVVARYEGGGGGFTLVAEPSGEQACLRIPPEGEPSCLDAPGREEVETALLPLVGQRQVLAGIGGNDVFRVEAHRAGGSVTSVLPTRIPETDVRGWAFATDAQDVERIVWFDLEGNQLGERSLG